MSRSYPVILQGNQGQSFVMVSSAKEASDVAAKAIHDGEQVQIEDAEHNIVSMERLAELIRDGEQEPSPDVRYREHVNAAQKLLVEHSRVSSVHRVLVRVTSGIVGLGNRLQHLAVNPGFKAIEDGVQRHRECQGRLDRA